MSMVTVIFVVIVANMHVQEHFDYDHYIFHIDTLACFFVHGVFPLRLAIVQGCIVLPLGIGRAAWAWTAMDALETVKLPKCRIRFLRSLQLTNTQKKGKKKATLSMLSVHATFVAWGMEKRR